MSVYTYEIYEVEKDRKRDYQILMTKIHTSLREHADEIPELLSYRTFEARAEGSRTLSVELFEFADERSSEEFFGRFRNTEWLKTLQKQCLEIVDPSKMTVHTWTGFLEKDWFVR